MKCPVCKSYHVNTTDFHSEQFSEDLTECKVCGSTWAINHGLLEVVKDTQRHSFLAAETECVEGDDYSWACA